MGLQSVMGRAWASTYLVWCQYCQFDRIWDHLEDGSLKTRHYFDCADSYEKTHQNCVGDCSLGWDPGPYGERKLTSGTHMAFLLFSCGFDWTSCYQLLQAWPPHHNGQDLWPVKWNKPRVALVWIFYPSTRKETPMLYLTILCLHWDSRSKPRTAQGQTPGFHHAGPFSSPFTQTPSIARLSLVLTKCFVNEWTNDRRIIKPNEVEFNSTACKSKIRLQTEVIFREIAQPHVQLIRTQQFVFP